MIRPSLSTAVRWLLLCIAAVLLGVIGLSSYTGTSPTLRKLSCNVRDALTNVNISRGSSSLASAGCESASTKSGEIYYVSCGGSF